MSEKTTDRGAVEADEFVRAFDDANENLRTAIHRLRQVRTEDMWPAEWARTLNESVTTLHRLDQIVEILARRFAEVPIAYDVDGYVTSTDGSAASGVCDTIEVILENVKSNLGSAVATIQAAIIRADKLQFEDYVDNR